MGRAVKRRVFLWISAALVVTATAMGLRLDGDRPGERAGARDPAVSVFEGVELVDQDPDGTRWRLRAASGSARESEVTGTLRDVHAEFERSGRRVLLQAGSALVDRGREVKLVSGVRVEWTGYSALVDAATYLRGEGTIRSDAQVDLRGPGFTVRGRGVEVDVEGRVARVLSEVHATVGGGKKP